MILNQVLEESLYIFLHLKELEPLRGIKSSFNKNQREFFGMEKQLDTQSNYDRNVKKFFGDHPRKSQTVADTFLNMEKKAAGQELNADPSSSIFKKDAAVFYGHEKYSET